MIPHYVEDCTNLMLTVARNQHEPCTESATVCEPIHSHSQINTVTPNPSQPGDQIRGNGRLDGPDVHEYPFETRSEATRGIRHIQRLSMGKEALNAPA